MENLPAYIPMDRRQAIAQGETLPSRCTGAALFADVSGFTPLTRAFAEEFGSKRGAEALLDILNPLFEALIAPVHRYGGSVIGFVGDAITCWFDDGVDGEGLATKHQPPSNSPQRGEDSASPPLGGIEGGLISATEGGASARAVACALAMQSAIEPLARVETPAGQVVNLSIKVAVAYGPARRFSVGDPAIQQMDALAGATLARMAATEGAAERGEVVVSQEVAVQLEDDLVVSGWRAEGSVAVVRGLKQVVATQPWPDLADLTDNQLSDDLAARWILPAVYQQLQANASLLGDLRPVAPLMLRFSGLDYDGDDNVAQKLDAFVRWVQSVIHRYEGNLLQLTIGDKGAFMYAVFGAPIAHEDDAARALRAALTLRDLPPTLAADISPLQIGLTQGEVWTGICGAQARHVYNAISSEVNLAARLMAQATPGQVLVLKNVAQTPGFTFSHQGDWQYKGFDVPLPTYQLDGEKLAEMAIFQTAMVGRDSELAQLLDFAQPLLADKLAGTAIIYGEAGIGKSRLTYALRQKLGPGVSWFIGQSDQILQQALNPFVYWLKRYFQQDPTASMPENKAQFEAQLTALLQALGVENPNLAPDAPELDPTRLSHLDPRIQILIPELIRTRFFLGHLLDLHWPHSLYEQLGDAQLRYDNTLIALKILLLAESCRQPLVFELEDGHWLDESSAEMLLTLSRNVAAYPLLILVTSRYEDDGSQPSFQLDPAMPTLSLDLTTLTRPALAQQAADLLGGPVASALLDLLWERSHANPFFAEQMVRHIEENGLLKRSADGVWHLEAAPSAVPPDVNTMLIARMDRLTQRIKEVVQTAAVLGREFEVRLLSQMLRAHDVTERVQAAEEEQIWSLLSVLRYMFKHALLRDAAYEMQLRSRLRELHYLAATHAETVYAAQVRLHLGLLAHHYERAYHLGERAAYAKARHYLQEAGEEALASYKNGDAISYISRALALTPAEDSEARYTLLLTREKAYHLLGQREEQAADLAALQALLPASPAENENSLWVERRAVVAYRQAEYAEAISDYEAAIRWAEVGIQTAQQAQNPVLEVELESVWGKTLWHKSDYQTAKSHFERAVAVAKTALTANPANKTALQAAMALNLNGLGIVVSELGEYETAHTYYEAALALYKTIDHFKGQSNCLNNLGVLSKGFGDYETARQYYTESLDIDHKIGDQQGISVCLNNLGILADIEDDYEAAQRYYSQGLTIDRNIGDRRGEGVDLNNLGLLAMNIGDYVTAQKHYKASLIIRKEVGDRRGESRVRANLCFSYFGQGELDLARQYGAEAVDIARQIEGQHELALSLLHLGHVLLAQNEVTAAQTAYQEAYDLWQAGKQHRFAIEPLAGLAQTALQQNNLINALDYVDSMLRYLAENELDKTTTYPFSVYLTCVEVLQAAQDERAAAVLNEALSKLKATAAKIAAPAQRALYWQIPAHQRLLALAGE